MFRRVHTRACLPIVSYADVVAGWDAAGEVIKAWACEGHSIPMPGLGTMRFSLSARTVSDVNDVKVSLIRTRRIIFTPAVELKDELRNTGINITCYDRDGNIVKQVTSDDPGVVEDGGDTGNGGQQTGDNTGDNTGGGDNGGDNVPGGDE